MESEKSVEFGLGFASDEYMEYSMEDGGLYSKHIFERTNEIESYAYNGRATGVMDLIEE